jgi:hypothetical protein
LTDTTITRPDLTADAFEGVERFLHDYAAVEPDDVVVVVYAPDSRDQAGLIATVLRMRGVPTTTVVMRALLDEGLPERLEGALPRISEVAGKVVVITLEADTMSHFEVFREVLFGYPPDRCRFVRVISSCAELFTMASKAPPAELTRRNAYLLDRLMGTKSLEVRGDGGTDLRIQLDLERYDWISNRGIWRPGAFMILPAGEVATYPADVEGVLVADGAVNCNVITRMDMRLAEHPLTVEIEGARAVDFHCADPDIHEFIRLCFDRPNGRRIGELGFGTNAWVTEFLAANSHLNERRPGVHLGFGQHNQRLSLVDYREAVHLDLITDGATIRVDGEPDVIDLRHLPEDVSLPHPKVVRDEDVTGDCCGFGISLLEQECSLDRPKLTRAWAE